MSTLCDSWSFNAGGYWRGIASHGVWGNSVSRTDVFQVYQNAIHFNLFQFCPFIPLFHFSVFLFCSSTVLSPLCIVVIFLLFQDSERVYGDFFHLVSKDLAMLFKRTYQLQKVSRIIDVWTTWNATLRFLSRIMQGWTFACKIFIFSFQKVKINSACAVYIPESSSLSLLGMKHSIL